MKGAKNVKGKRPEQQKHMHKLQSSREKDERASRQEPEKETETSRTHFSNQIYYNA